MVYRISILCSIQAIEYRELEIKLFALLLQTIMSVAVE